MVTTLKRTWQRLTRATPGKSQAELAAKYTHFQALLSANNQVLTLMADMEEKLSGDYLFDLQYIRAAVSQLQQETGQLVEALNGLGRNRYQGLSEALARISREVEEVLTRRREIPVAPLVIDFEALDAGMGDVVGGKNANLGEVKNLLRRQGKLLQLNDITQTLGVDEVQAHEYLKDMGYEGLIAISFVNRTRFYGLPSGLP